MGETVALTWVLGFPIPPTFNLFTPLAPATSLTMIINQQFNQSFESGNSATPGFAAAFTLFIMIGVVNIAVRALWLNEGINNDFQPSNEINEIFY